MGARLREFHAGDRAIRLKTIAWSLAGCVPLAGVVRYYLVETKEIGPLAQGGIMLAGVVFGIAVGLGIEALSAAGAHGLAHLFTGAGNLPPAPSFSYQEALIARGRYAEADDAFTRHLLEHPGDHDARLAQAALRETHLEDRAGAIELYRAVRHGTPSPAQALRADQELLDLYGRARDVQRYRVELSRFADLYRATAAGEAARAELSRIRAQRDAG